MPRITKENVKDNPHLIDFNPERALILARRAVLADFKDNLRAVFMKEAEAAVEEAVETIMKNVDGEMRHIREHLTMSDVFDIRFKVRDF